MEEVQRDFLDCVKWLQYVSRTVHQERDKED